MAKRQHLDLLKQGVEVWKRWRAEHPDIRPDLSGADLSGAYLMGVNLDGTNLKSTNLSGADLRGAHLNYMPSSGSHLRSANLSGANLTGADLSGAHLQAVNLSGANLSGANLSGADLSIGANLSGADFFVAFLTRANLTGVNLSGANLMEANLREANLSGADLTGADLTGATLVRADLRKATLTNCRVYGISVWDVNLAEAVQSSLIITLMPSKEPIITVDNLKVAQFLYLLLNNQEIREVIDTIGQKGVLILGRFSKERKPVLDALREKLRSLNFLPIVFDFERPTERDFTETVMTLAGLSLFVIADITNPKSSPLELQATVPNYMVPFVPIIQKGEQPFSMFRDLLGKYNWVLEPLAYDTPSNLIKVLEKAIVKPALEKHAELLTKKVEQWQTRDIGDYL